MRGESGKGRRRLANLGSNALKFGDPSGWRVTLSGLESAPAMCRARVEVFSGGAPRDEAERAALFGLFYRGQGGWYGVVGCTVVVGNAVGVYDASSAYRLC